MPSRQLNDLIDFIAQTGETAVFPHEGRSYVILPMETYLSRLSEKESKEGLTESQSVDRINREIARWKAAESVETLAIDSNSSRATLDDTCVWEDNTNVNH